MPERTSAERICHLVTVSRKKKAYLLPLAFCSHGFIGITSSFAKGLGGAKTWCNKNTQWDLKEIVRGNQIRDNTESAASWDIKDVHRVQADWKRRQGRISYIDYNLDMAEEPANPSPEFYLKLPVQKSHTTRNIPPGSLARLIYVL